MSNFESIQHNQPAAQPQANNNDAQPIIAAFSALSGLGSSLLQLRAQRLESQTVFQFNRHEQQIRALAESNLQLQNQVNELRARLDAPSIATRAWSFIKGHATKQNLILAGSLVVAAVIGTCKTIYA